MSTLVMILCTATLAAAAPAKPPSPAEHPPRVSGPYRHDNLDIYLIHGAGGGEKRKMTTLGDALAQKKVIVRETQTVSQLTIENVSSDVVYVQAGDIVKGGQQDRVLQIDLVLPPKSGRVDVAAFCVEQGRWRQRGREAVDQFTSSTANFAHKDLKIANYAGSQQQVWSSVNRVQNQLQSNVGGTVQSRESPSSLQLTMENDAVRKAVAGHRKALSALVDKHADAVGYAFAVNGTLSSADVYASAELFRASWAKLLEAAAVEAVAEKKEGQPAASPTVDAVLALIANTTEGAVTERAAATGTVTIVRETSSRLFVESRQKDENGWLRRGYVQK